MMTGWFCRLFCLFFSMFCLLPAFSRGQNAGTLRVTPVLIDVQAPVMNGSLKMSNEGARMMAVQVRVFKWVQQNGQDLFMPARGVAVSPPMISLEPRSETVLRVVRTSTDPLIREESYRLVIDQLPDSTLRRKAGSGISFVVRHNIPVFFSPPGELEPRLIWKVVSEKGGYRVTAVNSGTRHIGIAHVKLLAGKSLLGRLDGLAGYALAGSSGSFFVSSLKGGRPDRIQALDTNRLPIDDVIRP